jgi:hypothetical protein
VDNSPQEIGFPSSHFDSATGKIGPNFQKCSPGLPIHGIKSQAQNQSDFLRSRFKVYNIKTYPVKVRNIHSPSPPSFHVFHISRVFGKPGHPEFFLCGRKHFSFAPLPLRFLTHTDIQKVEFVLFDFQCLLNCLPGQILNNWKQILKIDGQFI